MRFCYGGQNYNISLIPATYLNTKTGWFPFHKWPIMERGRPPRNFKALTGKVRALKQL